MPSIRVLLVAASLLPAAALAGEVPVWFGTYTSAKTGSEGIYVARFDTDSGAVSQPVLAGPARNPSFLAFHPRLPLLYAVSEIAAADGRPSGAVEAFAIDEATGSLASRGAAETGGAASCLRPTMAAAAWPASGSPTTADCSPSSRAVTGAECCSMPGSATARPA